MTYNIITSLLNQILLIYSHFQIIFCLKGYKNDEKINF